MDTIKLNLKKVKMIAHRGLSGIERENTCSAFVAAGNRSYFGIETDVHLTKDGQFIIIHDDDLMRIAGSNMVVEETSFEKLRGIYLSDLNGIVRHDLFLPSLNEYIAICKHYSKECVLEIKNRMEKADIERLAGVIREFEWLERTIFISFEPFNLVALRQLLPDQRIQLLAKKMSKEVFDTLSEYRFDLDIKHTGISKSDIKQLKDLGFSVNIWTVNDPELAKTFAGYGVDFITTNILE